MAKRRRRHTKRRVLSAPVARRKTSRRRYRRNPEVYQTNPRGGRMRRYARRAGGRLLSGLSVKGAIREGVPTIIGMFAAKLAARKFGGGTETDPTTWTWGTYLKAMAGALGGAFVANMVRPGTGQKVLNGGLAFVLFKLVQNELIVKSPKALEWFGADETDLPEVSGADWDGYGFGADPNVLQLDGEGTPWMMSDDGQMLPLDERHRMGLDGADWDGAEELDGTWGEALVSPGRLGEALVSPGRLGQDVRSDYISAYRNAYQS